MAGNKYIVTGPTAVVIAGGSRKYLAHGAILPEGVDKARLEHLLEVGLIGKVEDEAAVVAPDAEADQGEAAGEGDANLEDLTVDQLRTLAAERDVDLAGATRKDDIISAIRAADQA